MLVLHLQIDLDIQRFLQVHILKMGWSYGISLSGADNITQSIIKSEHLKYYKRMSFICILKNCYYSFLIFMVTIPCNVYIY